MITRTKLTSDQSEYLTVLYHESNIPDALKTDINAVLMLGYYDFSDKVWLNGISTAYNITDEVYRELKSKYMPF